MTIRRKICSPFFGLMAFVALPFSTVLSASEAVGSFYRYKDANGNIVIERSIPAEMIPFGYEVLSDSGRVIRTVDRQLTDAEKAAQSEEQKQKRLAQEQAEKQREYDLQLLRKYSFVGDIESEKDRKVKEMEVRVQILQGNLLAVRNELEVEYDQAAKSEKKGRAVPEAVQQRIQGLEAKLTTTEQLMKNLENDMEATRKLYLLAIERFQELKALRNR